MEDENRTREEASKMKDRIRILGCDTDGAKKIGEFSSNLPDSDFGYYKEALYKKQTGEYFLAGEGGPVNRYTKTVKEGHWQEKSARIKPLTFVKAKEWYKDFILDSDDEDKKETERVYRREFGSVDDKK